MDNLINTYKYYMFPVKLQVWPRDKIIFTSKKKNRLNNDSIIVWYDVIGQFLQKSNEFFGPVFITVKQEGTENKYR